MDEVPFLSSVSGLEVPLCGYVYLADFAGNSSVDFNVVREISWLHVCQVYNSASIQWVENGRNLNDTAPLAMSFERRKRMGWVSEMGVSDDVRFPGAGLHVTDLEGVVHMQLRR